MKTPPAYLLDLLLGYARDSELSVVDAAAVVAEFAKQRSPELEAEEKIRDARYKVQRTVEDSAKELLVARFLVKTRVRYVSWTYYPEFHVCTEPRDFWWCSIWFETPNWKPVIRPDRFYIDDLFHAPDEGKFWMKEPYLDGLPESEALYRELTKSEFEVLEGTRLRKIDPRVIRAFKGKRVGISEFTTAYLVSEHAFRRPHYGSKGWQARIKLVPMKYKQIRLR